MLALCNHLRLIAHKSLLTFTLRRTSVHGMALARARGCAGSRLRSRGPAPQADASRRQNGPRKATSRRLITVRLRGKSCPSWGHRVSRVGRRAVVAIVAANPSAGGCGVENQVGRASAVLGTRTGRGSRWKLLSEDITSASQRGSVSTLRPRWPSWPSSIRRRCASM